MIVTHGGSSAGVLPIMIHKFQNVSVPELENNIKFILDNDVACLEKGSF